jgi:hypothetical protein
METDNTLSLSESAQEILTLIATRDTIREKIDNDVLGNSYLILVAVSLEKAIRNLADKVADATK